MASAGTAVPPAPSQCDNCQKTEGSFKLCTKCRTAAYCDHDCQKAHWKEHKKMCSAFAAARFRTPQSRNATPPKRSNAKPFTAIYNNNFLHDRPEEETFKILIDVIRMRQEDTYNFEGDTMDGTIYSGEQTSEKAFRQFLRKSQQIHGFLPPWWSDKKAEDCVRFALQSSDFSLAAAREKADIQDTWGDHQMPMKLRMLGEKVYGNTPGGARSDSMLSVMMGMEGGSFGSQMRSTTVDVSRSFGGTR